MYDRCDCGVKTLSSCLFSTSQRPPNSTSKNLYNANFLNKYCWCGRPYEVSASTPEKMSESVTSSVTNSTTDCVMRQCYFCQDWFHEDCIQERAREWMKKNEKEGKRGEERKEVKLVAIDGDVFGSYACPDCAAKGQFFMDSYSLLVNPFVWLTAEEEEVDVVDEFPLSLPSPPAHGPVGCKRYFQYEFNIFFLIVLFHFFLNFLSIPQTSFFRSTLPIHTDSRSQVWACDRCETHFRVNEALRFHCLDCEDFDLCGLCYSLSSSSHQHPNSFELSELGVRKLYQAGLMVDRETDITFLLRPFTFTSLILEFWI